jgi:two-component system response regulator HydG
MSEAAAAPASTATLLVADDDPGLRESLERTLTREGYKVMLASDGRAALERLQAGGVDLVLTDLKMPGLTGLEVLRAAKAIAPDVDVILLTAFGTVEEAVQAMKDGAYDFLTKPFRREQLLKLIDKALERRDLITKNRALQQRLDDLLRQGAIVGTSPAFRRMMTLVEQVADSSATVLIQGESGAGKESVVRAIHERSPRRSGPFVAVNCAALPETLLESELFGYEKGAFTGAAGRKEGRFELADGGTLFLDEVADLSPVTQPKILRVLQEGEFERLGGTRTLRVDVRIVAATNQDLAQMVKEKRFREDLYYRLNVITINVPPLRERREDISVLAQHFLRVYAAKNNRRLEGLTDDAVRRLEAHAWPGNVRELENVIERGVVLARGARVDVIDLPPEIAGATPLPEGVLTVRIGTPLAEIEARLLDATLRATKGNKTLTAKLLGIDPRTVSRKLERQDEAEAEDAADDPPQAP